MELLDILKRETEHSPNVYLYEENNNWYAYEHSAELLNKRFGNLVNVKRVIYDTFLQLKIAEFNLNWLQKDCPIISCSDTELVIVCPKEICMA